MRKALILLIIALASTATGAWYGGRRVDMPQLAGPTLHIAFINVDGGESALIQSPNGRAALIDTGGPDDGPVIANFLRRHGVGRLDLLILTRPTSEHIGGVAEVLDAVRVDHVVDCGSSYSYSTRAAALKDLYNRKIPYKTACSGQRFRLGGGVTITVLLPEKPLTEAASNANNNAVVARVSFGDVSSLLLSGIGPQEEAKLIGRCGNLQCDVVKLSRRRSAGNTSNEFLRLAKPAYAVISSQSEGYAYRQTVRRLKAAGVKIERTRDCNAVIVATDGRDLRITREL